MRIQDAFSQVDLLFTFPAVIGILYDTQDTPRCSGFFLLFLQIASFFYKCEFFFLQIARMYLFLISVVVCLPEKKTVLTLKQNI